jgi:hypothetical protein
LAGKLCPPNRQLLIQQYLNQPATLKKASGSQRESVIPEAFRDPLKGWARSHDLVFIPEYEIETKNQGAALRGRRPALRAAHALRLLGGIVRTSGERRRREGSDISDDRIRIGVAVFFLVRNEERQRLPDLL